MSSDRKHSLVLAGKLLATFFIFAFLFHRLDLLKIREILTSIDPWLYATGVLIYAPKTFLLALATQRILKSVKVSKQPLEVMRVNVISYFFSFLGEIVGGAARWAGFSGEDNRRGEAFFAIVTERFLFLSVIFLFFLAAAFTLSSEGRLLPEMHFIWPGTAMAGILLLVFFSVLFFPFFTGPSKRLITRARESAWLEPVAAKCLDLIRVTENFRKGRRHFAAAFFIFTADACLGFLAFRLILASLGFEADIFTVIFVSTLVAMAQVLPITVYGLGIREGCLVYFLGRLAEVPGEAGLVMGLLLFFINLLMGAAGGCWMVRSAAREASRKKLP